MNESPTDLVTEALTLLERALSRLQTITHYNKSEKGKQRRTKYNKSAKAKARDKRYNHSPAHKATLRRYEESLGGRIVRAMNNQRFERKLSKRLHSQEQRLGKRPHIF